jgi:hypothetical protein
MSSIRLANLLSLALLLFGCSGWHRVDSPQPGTDLPVRRQVRIWQHNHAVIVHSVRVRGDSLSGVPYIKPPSCDSCRIAFALSAIDSIQSGNTEQNYFLIMGAVGAFVVLGIVFVLSLPAT